MSDTNVDPEATVLSDLAHALVDQIMLYGLARENAQAPAVVAALGSAKASYAKLLHDLNGKIWLHGIPAIEQGSAIKAGHNAASRMREVASRGDHAVLDDVLRGDRRLISQVHTSMANDKLPVHTLNYLQTVVSRIEAVPDEIEALR